MDTFGHALSMCRSFSVTEDMVKEHVEKILAMTDLNEVNKFLYELGKNPEGAAKYEEAAKTIKPTQGWQTKAFEQLHSQIEAKSREEFYSIVSSERETLEQWRREYTKYLNKMTEARATYAAKYQTYKNMEKIYNSGETLTYDPEKLVKEACSDGFYHFCGIRDGFLIFTTDAVTMSHEGVDLNFGHMLVKIHMNGSSHAVFPLIDNLNVHGYYHPHVSDSRYLCMGEAEGAILEAAKTRDYAATLSLIRAILLNYNHDSPYVSFDAFVDAEENEGRGDYPDTIRMLDRMAQEYGFERQAHKILTEWDQVRYNPDSDDEYEEEYEEEEIDDDYNEDDIDW